MSLQSCSNLFCFQCYAEDYQLPYNASRSTWSGISAYRSALTLDWLADEDSRQREIAHVYESDAPVLHLERGHSECMAHSKPATGKVAKLMLELLKNIEGDDGVIQELTHTLIRVKLLIETSMLDAEPDLNSLVQTPKLMLGEPHVTLPRVLAVVWMLASDPIATKASGWCSIKKLSQYLMVAPPAEIAARMRAVDPILARARFILEDFMQNVTPLYMKRQTMPMELRPKLRRHRNRPHYVPTSSSLVTKAPHSKYGIPQTEQIVTETKPPIPEPVQLKALRGSVTRVSVTTKLYMWLFLCYVI